MIITLVYANLFILIYLSVSFSLYNSLSLSLSLSLSRFYHWFFPLLVSFSFYFIFPRYSPPLSLSSLTHSLTIYSFFSPRRNLLFGYKINIEYMCEIFQLVIFVGVPFPYLLI